MKIEQQSDGQWRVVNDDGTLVASNLSNAQAWRIFDRNAGDAVSVSERTHQWSFDQSAGGQ